MKWDATSGLPACILLGFVGMLLVSCSDDKAPTNPSLGPDPSEYVLTIIAGEGITGLPPSGTYPAGTVVTYGIGAAAGYEEPVIVLDTAIVPVSGKFIMDRDRVLIVAAQRAPITLSPSDEVQSAATALLSAADPVAAFQTLVDVTAELEKRVGVDSTTRHLAAVSDAVFDWADDPLVIERLSAALHGQTFEYRVPLRPGVARAPTTRISGDSMAEPARTAIVYTNGILTTPDDALQGLRVIADVARQTIPGVELPTAPDGQTGPVIVRLVYNHSIKESYLEFGSRCARRFVRVLMQADVATVILLAVGGKPAQIALLGCFLDSDVGEALKQWTQLRLKLPIPVPEDALALADSITALWARDYRVILVAHSQGNLMALQALDGLPPLGEEPSTCVSMVGFAPPVTLRRSPSAARVDGITIGYKQAIDFIAALTPSVSLTSTRYARDLDATAPSAWNPVGVAAWVFAVGYWLHGLTDSYLLPHSESREWASQTLGTHYETLADRCPPSSPTVVSISIRPLSTTVPAGDTAILTAVAHDADGFDIAGVQFEWVSSDTTIAQVDGAGVVTGVAVGGPIAISATSGGVTGRAEVTVIRSDTIAPGNWAYISAGYGHNCALDNQGIAYCWGRNRRGALGDGTGVSRTEPAPVSGGLRFTSISAGADLTCGVTMDHVGYCWGWNSAGGLGAGISSLAEFEPVRVAGSMRFASISAGSGYACGVTTDGAGYCWGANGGVLGDGTTTNRRTPVRVVGDLRFRSIAARLWHTCGVTTDGRAYCWGVNSAGQLGHGEPTRTPQTTPVPVAGGLHFVSIAVGGTSPDGSGFTCGLNRDQHSYCWGENGWGMLGDSTTTKRPEPVQVVGGLKFMTTDTGNDHTCAITLAGAAYCWGGDHSGKLGVGPWRNLGSPSPRPVVGGLHFLAISAGVAHTCGITVGGALYCWGEGGELGTGGVRTTYIPTRVRDL